MSHISKADHSGTSTFVQMCVDDSAPVEDSNTPTTHRTLSKTRDQNASKEGGAESAKESVRSLESSYLHLAIGTTAVRSTRGVCDSNKRELRGARCEVQGANCENSSCELQEHELRGAKS